MKIIEKQSGSSLILNKGQRLKVTDICGEQVSDLVAFNANDKGERYSAGKTMDFEESILLTKGNFLWSNRGNKLMEIKEDTCGRHDTLLAPCSDQTFQIMYGIKSDHPSCFNNLRLNLKEYNITADDIPTAFNIFMNVQFDQNGKLSVCKLQSKAGDFIILEAQCDLIIGLTACSAPDSNNGSFKEIGYEVIDS
ncbi:MAG: urea carboxylase-associated family protein [Nonlabens sp.]